MTLINFYGFFMYYLHKENDYTELCTKENKVISFLLALADGFMNLWIWFVFVRTIETDKTQNN